MKIPGAGRAVRSGLPPSPFSLLSWPLHSKLGEIVAAFGMTRARTGSGSRSLVWSAGSALSSFHG
jgi:hypothetical protein